MKYQTKTVKETALSLLNQEIEWIKTEKKLEGCKIEIQLPFDAVETVLDMLGYPVSNVLETNADERYQETGVWPEESFCRDTIRMDWYDYVENNDAAGYIELIEKVIKELETTT